MFYLFIGDAAAVYATTGMVESVRKAQEEAAAGFLSRALHLCKEKMASNQICLLFFIFGCTYYVDSNACIYVVI